MLIAAALLAATVNVPSPAASGDADNDGLPDAWETSAGRAFGCDPRHADLLVYAVERTTNTANVNDAIAGAVKFYAAAQVENPDGKPGIRLHVIRGPKITDRGEYPDLKAKFLPRQLAHRAHFHVFDEGEGGQTCIECGASISGITANGWNSFAHELGHQLGLDHQAQGFKVQSPLHVSIMNYDYEFDVNGSPDEVQFSNGRFARLRMRESDLDETLPFPIASLGFLAKDPYGFPLKAVGSNTQVDWNRNGTFGEKGVRADINYASGASLGERVNVEKAETGPAAVYRGKDLYIAYGVAGADRFRTVFLRKFLGKDKWGPRVETRLTGTVGDPTMAVLKGDLWIAAADRDGIHVAALHPSGDGGRIDESRTTHLAFTGRKQATLATLDDRLFLVLRDVRTRRISYMPYSGNGQTWGPEVTINLTSDAPPGVAWHPVRRQAVLAVTAKANYPNRVAIHFLAVNGDRLELTGESDWLGGADGGTATLGRPAVLVDTSRDAGRTGRVYAYYMAGGKDSPAYFSMQVADRGFHGGWLERSIFDVWTKTASAPAAALDSNGDITYCYREQDDSMLKCAFHASGVEDGEMGDFDELAFIRNEGLRDSLAR